MQTYSAILLAEREAGTPANTNAVEPEPTTPVEGSNLTLTHSSTYEELSKRITGFVVEKRFYERVKQLIPSVVPSDEDDYVRDFTEKLEYDTRIYTLQGHNVRVLVPEKYAQKLDIVRQRRLGQIPLLPEDMVGYLNRALPEDILEILDEVPNRGYITDVHLLDWANSRDKLTQVINKSATFVSAASTMPNGEIMLYKFDVGDWLRTTLLHEWNHHLQKKFMDIVNALWEAAVALEWFKWVKNDYAKTNTAEHWAVFGEAMLQKSGPDFAQVVNDLGPMRALVWTMALSKALDEVPEAERSVCHDIWVARVAYAQKNSLSQAAEKAAFYMQQAQRLGDWCKMLATPTLVAVA